MIENEIAAVMGQNIKRSAKVMHSIRRYRNRIYGLMLRYEKD